MSCSELQRATGCRGETLEPAATADEVGDELMFHFRRLVDDKLAAGLSFDDAWKEAEEQFGPMRRYDYECRMDQLARRRQWGRWAAAGCLAIAAVAGWFVFQSRWNADLGQVRQLRDEVALLRHEQAASSAERGRVDVAVAGEEAAKTKAAAPDKSSDKTTDKTTGNILANSGFEDGDKTPANWQSGADIDGVEYVWDKDVGLKGKASLCLNKTAKRYFPIAQWYQIVERKTDRPSLQVTAQVKAEAVTKAIVDVIFLDENDEMISHEWASYIGAKDAKDKPAQHDWKEYQGKVKIPAKAKKIQIGLQIYGPGKVWFDEVRAEYVE